MPPPPSEEQQRPFLEPERDSLHIELSQLDGDRTPQTHYNQPKTSPAQGKNSPWLIGAVLLITVIGFVVNTESTEYFESELGWKKPFATMYVTHSSLTLPWIVYMAYDRFKHRNTSYSYWYQEHKDQLVTAIETIDAYPSEPRRMDFSVKGTPGGPLNFLLVMMGVLTIVLTASGVSWFIALAWTTPADLTAIYNCSTFFAAAFSVPLLKERLGPYSIVAVGLSIVGTFIIAYGDTTAEHDPGDKVGTSRLFGNLVAALGALAFGLYEVLFKKWACSSKPMAPSQSLPLTLTASALTGFYTFGIAWIALVFFHIFGVETFVWPSARVWMWIVVAVLSGSISITMLAVLVVWTDPVFGSFANVLSVFFVALSDWLLFGLTPSLATYAGGVLVVVAFSLLTWDTFYGKHR